MASAQQHQHRIGDFYAEVVLPALADRLDAAFPEFGWKRDARGWVATNDEMTHRVFGARAERIVAHGPAPRGFLVHGADSTLWTAYVNGGVVPRGETFASVVRQIAERAGVDTSPVDRPHPRNRTTDLLHDFFNLCQLELHGNAGTSARAYLENRGLPTTVIDLGGLGVVPHERTTKRALETAGYSELEVAKSGVLADGRWPGRLCGAWRDERGGVRTLWARSIRDSDPATRYLYLRGASRTDLPPYGLSEVLRLAPSERREIVLVEGLLDFHQLHTRGFNNVAALGGTSTGCRTFEQLHRQGIEHVTLCMDNDNAGRAATAKAVEHAARARRSPHVVVVDPERLSPAKDPDQLLRERGPDSWSRLLQTRSCGIVWRAQELAATIGSDSPARERRDALARAGFWLGTLPPRLALEQEDAVQAVADRCGYSREAVQRAFRARFWTEPRRVQLPELSRGR